MDECPNCGKEIEDMVEFFVANEYEVYFDMECEHCGCALSVEVDATPHFDIKTKVLDRS
jgi:ferredoxin